MAKRKRKYRERRDFNHGIQPTPERAKHNGGIVMEVRDSNEADSVRIVGPRARYESLIDRWLDEGKLGRHQQAGKRHDMAIWLRELHANTHPSEVQDFTGASGGNGEMSDAQAWNFECYKDSMMDMGQDACAVVAVVCEDQERKVEPVLRGLDRLIERRWI